MAEINSQDEHGAQALDALEVRGVTVHYRSKQSRVIAVDDASFTAAHGEIVALTGPSGCGKSTLLRAIAGLEPLTAGSVHWGEHNLSRIPPHRRGFGLMFQDGQLFGHLSVAGNIAYGLKAKRMPRERRNARVAELLELVDLPDYGARSITELSGGERQRIALARSLAPAPRLLLLDEPLSALDRSLRERLAGDLAVMLRRAKTTAILVTHDEEEARVIADRRISMRAGKLVS